MKMSEIAFNEQKNKYLNILIITFSIIFAGLIFLLLSIMFESKKDISFVSVVKNDGITKVSKLKLRKHPLDYYDKILSKEKLFVVYGGRNKKSKLTPVSMLGEISISQLSLQGVVSGAKGPQAIILDTKTDQTFFCYSGDSVGDFNIIEVRDDRALLEKDAQEFELRL